MLKTPCEQSLPPSADALALHSKCANYQAAIHRRSLQQFMKPPTPLHHGWKVEDRKMAIVWMTKPQAPPEILKNIHCSCKKSKCETMSCFCLSNWVSCTELCKCQDCGNGIPFPPEQSLLDDASDSGLSDKEDV